MLYYIPNSEGFRKLFWHNRSGLNVEKSLGKGKEKKTTITIVRNLIQPCQNHFLKITLYYLLFDSYLQYIIFYYLLFI